MSITQSNFIKRDFDFIHKYTLYPNFNKNSKQNSIQSGFKGCDLPKYPHTYENRRNKMS